MKRIFLLICSITLLISCGDGKQSADVSVDVQYNLALRNPSPRILNNVDYMIMLPPTIEGVQQFSKQIEGSAENHVDENGYAILKNSLGDIEARKSINELVTLRYGVFKGVKDASQLTPFDLPPKEEQLEEARVQEEEPGEGQEQLTAEESADPGQNVELKVEVQDVMAEAAPLAQEAQQKMQSQYEKEPQAVQQEVQELVEENKAQPSKDQSVVSKIQTLLKQQKTFYVFTGFYCELQQTCKPSEKFIEVVSESELSSWNKGQEIFLIMQNLTTLEEVNTELTSLDRLVQSRAMVKINKASI